MNDLLPHYEREIALLRNAVREFAMRHPKIATRFGIADGHSDDMHVERMLQSFALLGAQIGESLDDDYPAFTECTTRNHMPRLSASVSRVSDRAIRRGVDVQPVDRRRDDPARRHARKRGRREPVPRRVDVALAPVTIVDARYRPASAAPSAARMPPSSTGIVSITFDSLTAQPVLAAPRAQPARAPARRCAARRRAP
ncbi:MULTISPECIES: type VI secretion system baseplate subunit TssF [Burkholderia]|uniref:type VI secretion system baseplate subunit TssF n=1 Tax=Burkholderia TaxID=32008 RepID=UPI000B0FB278|nr:MULTISPECIES: type VI secretion system baseplate subunit TssF [Burkholderia]